MFSLVQTFVSMDELSIFWFHKAFMHTVCINHLLLFARMWVMNAQSTLARKWEQEHATMPKRIQRKRCAGWRMPPNTVYVGRPTCYGNPWKVGTDGNPETVLLKYRKHLELCLLGDPDFLSPLKGKDLACWCRLDSPCHADILLEFLEKSV